MSGDCVVIQKMEGVVKSSKGPGVSALKKKLPKAVAGISPPPIKKLKQGRLPFKPLDTKPQQLPAIISPNTKKRKLSDPLSGPQKACKSKRSEEICTQAEPPKKVDDADNEVSSSSEPNVDDKNSKKRNFSGGKPKPVGLIEKFLKTTQQLEVTTSCLQDEESETAEEVIDLTDSQPSKKVDDADDKNGPEPEELEPEPTESCVDENLNVSDKKQTDESQKEKDEDDDKQRDSTNPDEKCDGTDPNENEASGPNPEAAAAEDPDSTGAEADAEESEDEDKEDENKGDVDSPSSEKSKSPENSPTANMNTTTPCSAKRSRSKLPLSSEKKAKREAERLKREEEKERLKQERQKAKEEKERLKREEKEKKDQEKAEAKLKKEKEKQEKQEQKEKERKLKEEEQKKKDEEKKKMKEAADAEKKKKEEERKKKDDEKKKKEEEKQKIEEEKMRKKQKEQSAFQSFFTKSNKEILQAAKPQTSGKFVGFQIKDDMRLAPTLRVEALREEKAASLDKAFQDQCSELYLDELKQGKIQKGTAGKTWPWSAVKDLVEISEDEPVGKTMRTKFLKFKENHRPPYYGTWRKQSSKIKPRKPLEKDEDLLDYEVDSDDEWEEEEPGESLSNSEGEDEEKEDNDEEEEDGFFVPHGYLSEGEGCEDDEEDVSPEALKARQVAKARAWDADMKKKCEVLKPICLGCCWVLPDVPRDPTFETLAQFKVVSFVESSKPIPVKKVSKKAESLENEKNKDEKDWKSKILKPVPEEAMADLVRLVHGNVQSSKKLIREFRVYWQRKFPSSLPNQPAEQEADKSEKNNKDALNTTDASLEASQEKQCAISKRQLEMKLKEIAVYEKQQGFNKICWYVKKPVLEKYKLTDLPVPTQWQWITIVKEKQRTTSPKTTAAAAQTPTSGKKTSTIKHFTKEVSPTKLFSPTTPKSAPRTTQNACSPATPGGQTGIRTPTQRKTPLQGVKTTPTIKQFVVPQASPFRVKTPGTPKSVPSPHAPDLGSPLAMLLKSSPKTPSSDGTLKGKARRAQLENAKKPDAAASDHGSKQPQMGSETNHTSTENTNNNKNQKAQPTLLAMLNKAALPEDDCISTSAKNSQDKHSKDKIGPTTDAIPSSSVKGTGTAEEPMEID